MPVSTTGRCCDTCNAGVVLPNRAFGSGVHVIDLRDPAHRAASVSRINRQTINEIKAKKRAAKAVYVAKHKAKEHAWRVLMRMERTEGQRQCADEAAKIATTNATIARLSRRCVAAALEKMPVMAEAKALEAEARRKAAAVRELNVAAGIKAAKAAKAAKEQRAEEALAKAGNTTKRARKRTKCCK